MDKINKAEELEREAKKLRSEVHNDAEMKKIKKAKKFEAMHGIHVYYSDDYAGLDVGDLSFYYGYEVTDCPVKSHKDEEDCYEKDCEKREWCFTAHDGEKICMKIPTSELYQDKYEDNNSPVFYVLAGIAHYLKRRKK